MQQLQKMAGDRILARFDADAPSGVTEVIPVAQHAAEGGEQPVGGFAGAGGSVRGLFRQRAAERRNARAQHVHRMRRCRQCLQHLAHHLRQPAQGLQLAFVAVELGLRRQLLVHQQVGDFLELAARGDLQDIVAAVMQIVAGSPDRA